MLQNCHAFVSSVFDFEKGWDITLSVFFLAWISPKCCSEHSVFVQCNIPSSFITPGSKVLAEIVSVYHFIQIKCHIKCHNVVYTWPTFHDKQWCFFRVTVTLINSCCPEKTTLSAHLLFMSLLRVISSFHLHHEQEKRKERKKLQKLTESSLTGSICCACWISLCNTGQHVLHHTTSSLV